MLDHPVNAVDRSMARVARAAGEGSTCDLALPELVHLPFAAEWLAEAGACAHGAAPADEHDEGFHQ